MACGGREQRQTKTGCAGQPSGMPKRQNSHEHLQKPKSTRWKEEEINGHAMFLGCLLMAVRGLGFLMLTWISVVLLGGFVSNLGTVDFWALTMIALHQIIGVFSFFHQLKYRNIRSVSPNMFPCCGCDRDGREAFRSRMRKTFYWCPSFILVTIFVLVMAVGVAVFTAAYILGLVFIFTGGILVVFILLLVAAVVRYGLGFVAIWSMVRVLALRTLFFTSASHGPGMFGSNASQLPNLIPAVDAAYLLGVAQGAFLLYWRLCFRGHTRILKDVTSGLKLDSESKTVRRYWQETVAGCEKDLTFAAGRNLMTYAVELMLESKQSPDRFLSGIRILGTVIRQGHFSDDVDLPEELLGRLVLIKKLLTGSESFCHLIEKLLQMLGPKSTYGMEIRAHAARIVLLVAHEIHLEEHPRCIECVSSLLDTFEQHQNPPYGYQRRRELRDTPYEQGWCLEWYERSWIATERTSWEKKSAESGDEGDDDNNCDLQAEGYMEMVWLGLSILEKLAADENNCSVMISTSSLLPRKMAPLCFFNVIHLRQQRFGAFPLHQSLWRIAAASLAVMYRLAQAPGEDGKALRGYISGNKDSIRDIQEWIFNYYPSWPALETAMGLLTLLCMDASLDMQETTKQFIQFLLEIFAGSNGMEIRTLAGRKLALLSSQKPDVVLALDGILVSLKDIFLSYPRSTLGIVAVEIMDHLCEGNCTVDGECHRNMKDAMTAVMPQVLTELFRSDGLTGETTPTVIEQGGVEPRETEEAISIAPDDIENPIASQGNSQNGSSPSYQKMREAEQKENIEWKKALLSLSAMFFDKFASDDDQSLRSLLDEVALKLTQMAYANMQPTADSLRIMKLITKLFISLVRRGYVTEGMGSLVTSVTRASNEMLYLDGLLLCSGVEVGANRTFSTLCSLVKEAQKLVDSCNAREVSMVQDSSPRNN
ncbi:unnamed protein product [Urochloa decumbens]|uniref:Uncharacterized protein n=1 Tax=Urochloa decumbens TaxID=240449 RepID=A0ABC8WBN9_9POAL